MTTGISTLGLQYVNINNLTKGQTRLSALSEQLSSGEKYSTLAQYTSSEVKKMINLSNTAAEKESYLLNIAAIMTRVEVYDSSLTSIEDISSEAITTIITATTYDSSKTETLATQFANFLDQMEYYLNQKVNGRYIYAGSRYSTLPVGDMSALLSEDPTLSYITGTDELPLYDSDYGTVDADLIASAYHQDTVPIDTEQDLQYGVTSTHAGFQKIILGLRYAYAATQDQANYAAYMQTANTYITEGLQNVRALHAGVAGAASALGRTEAQHESYISSLKSQIDDIQSVDVNEVAIKISTYQATLQSAYAATAQMVNLSILHYL